MTSRITLLILTILLLPLYLPLINIIPPLSTIVINDDNISSSAISKLNSN